MTVDGNATVKIVDNSKGFIDTQDHWAKDAIDFVSARGLVNGMTDTIYAPNNSTTRAQLWTILARQNDADLSGGSIWYEKAQNWAKDKGVSDGANPNAAINRAQMVTMLWRAEGQPTAGSTANFTEDVYKRQSIYRTGPYVWVLFRNSSGTPKYLNETVATYDRKFMKGDVITISAKAPEAGKRFTHWTWECVDKSGNDISLKFLNGTSAASANAEIKIPDPENIKPAAGDHNLYFTANYEDIPTNGVTPVSYTHLDVYKRQK